VADRIELRGLRFAAIHGALPQERERAQPFEVDVDIDADLAGAGRTDDLADTVDYGAVADAVATVMNGPPASLLEHLAERVAAAALGATGGLASSVTVTVRKLRPPISGEVSSAGVRITRSAPGR